MSKVFHDTDDGAQVLDLDTIWRNQLVSEALLAALLLAAAGAHEAITHPPTGVRNMAEWAKQQGCWHAFKSRQLEYGEHLDEILVSIEDARTNVREARVTRVLVMASLPSQKLSNSVQIFGVKFWIGDARKEKLLPKNCCCSMSAHLCPVNYQLNFKRSKH